MEVRLGEGIDSSLEPVSGSLYFSENPVTYQNGRTRYLDVSAGLASSWAEQRDTLGASAVLEAKIAAFSGKLDTKLTRSLSTTRTSFAWNYGAMRSETFALRNPLSALSTEGKAAIDEIRRLISQGDGTAATKMYEAFTDSCGDEIVDSVTLLATEIVTFKSEFSSSDEKRAFELKVDADYGSGTYKGNATFKEVARRLGEDFGASKAIKSFGSKNEETIGGMIESDQTTIDDIVQKSMLFLSRADMSAGKLIAFTSRPWHEALALVGVGADGTPRATDLLLAETLEKLEIVADYLGVVKVIQKQNILADARLSSALRDYDTKLKSSRASILVRLDQLVAQGASNVMLPEITPPYSAAIEGMQDKGALIQLRRWSQTGLLKQRAPGSTDWYWDRKHVAEIDLTYPSLVARIDVLAGDNVLGSVVFPATTEVQIEPVDSRYHADSGGDSHPLGGGNVTRTDARETLMRQIRGRVRESHGETVRLRATLRNGDEVDKVIPSA